jgi:hypothetical protein
MRVHEHSHPLRGTPVVLGEHARDSLGATVLPGATFFVRDWYDVIRRTSWRNEVEETLALEYAFRRAFEGLPDDEDAVIGEISGVSIVVHASEINGIAQPALVGV